MTIQAGDKVPDATFRTMGKDGIQEITTKDLFGGKRVVLFAVPGAFTPTCSDTHLPGFQVRAEEIKAKGIDTVACVAVNDVFVMASWAKARNASGDILFLADGNGDFTRAAGLELDLGHFGMGKRSKRYAAIIDDGVVQEIGVESAGEVGVSSAETILAKL